MSAGGFIAQALLGGTQGAAQGIGNKIREEAKLKRQQALEQTRSENRMQEQAHGSALNIGEQNLQNEYTSEQAELDREHDLALADKQHNQSKDLADYKLTTELTLARKQAEESGKLSDWQNAHLDRINGNIDHLLGMEAALEDAQQNGGTIINMIPAEDGAMSSANNAEKLAIIRQRLKAEEIKFNRVLGNQKGVDAGMAILSQAANITGEQDQQEFLTEFKKSRAYSEDLEREVMQVWDSKDKPSQKVEAPEASGQPGENTVLKPDPQPEPEQDGLISQAGGAPNPKPEQAPSNQEPSTMPDNVDMTPNNNSAKTLQEQIVARSREQKQENYQQAAKEAQRSVENHLMYGTFNKMNSSAKAKALREYGQYLPAMAPEVIEQMKSVFGADAIEQYLN